MWTVLMLVGAWLTGWLCRSFVFWLEGDCADPTHDADAYRRGLEAAFDAVQGRMTAGCDCLECEALDYASVDIVALMPHVGHKDGCPDA